MAFKEHRPRLFALTDGHAAALREHLDERQVVELTALVAQENSRARINDAMGVVSQDFCAVPVTAR